jgi:hypothetical protein
MSITYAVDEGSRLIRTVGSGEVTAGEVASHLEELDAHLHRDVQFDVLLDLGGCTSLPTSEQLRAIAEQLGRLGGRHRFGRCAIVAQRDALFGMTRMFEVFAQEQFAETRAFRATDEAERWLRSAGGRPTSSAAPR